jgi:hypothetical protein
MRILVAFAMLAVLGVTPAFADVLGCGCDKPDVPPPDMSMPRDLSPAPDLAAPSDLSGLRDARRERRRRHRAAGAGMLVLSGLGACGVVVARRRVRA